MWAGTTRAQVPDPHLVWRTVATPNFSIHYHRPLDTMAQEVAAIAERAHAQLKRSLGFSANQHTHVLLSDLTDRANGIASVLPRPVVRLFAAAPPDLAPIGDYDHWLSLLVTHEHTHIHHLSAAGGVASLVNALFGPTYAPNSILPGWFIEGLATYEESRHGSAGRMRSPLFDMFLRMDASEKRLLRLDQISNDPIRWPHQNIRYLYGSRFVGHIAKRYGEQALSDFGKHYGRQPLPFGLNRIALRVTGRTFDDLYADFLDETRRRYAQQLREISARGLVVGKPIARALDITRTPRFLPDGRLAYFTRDGVKHPQIRTLDGTRLTLAVGTASLSPHPDSRRLLLSMRAPHRDIYAFDDLFSLNLDSGELTRLTEGLRAREPDVSPNGHQLIFVTQAAGTSQLEIAELSDVEGTRQPLYRGKQYDQVFTPRFSPDGRSVVFSAWRRGGYRDVLLYDIGRGTITEITRDRANDTGPVFSRSGQVVFFSSDRDGVANLYAHELATGLTRRVTNVLGGAFQAEPTLDGQALVYVSYESRGFGLHKVLIPSVLPLAEPYSGLRPSPTQPPGNDHSYPVEEYDPLQTLAPVAYSLSVQTGPLGTEAQLSTSGQDVAQFHTFGATLRLAIDDQIPGAVFSYAYDRLPIRPRLTLFRTVTARDDLRVGGARRQWFSLNTGGALSLSYRFRGVFASHSISLGYSLQHVARAQPFGGRLVPTDPAPELPTLGLVPSANLTLRYDDSDRQAYDVTPSRARRARLRLEVIDPIMGREIRAVRLRWDITGLVPMPYADNHVLAIRYDGAQAGGDRGAFGRFRLGGYPDISPFQDPTGLLLEGRLEGFSGASLRGFPQAHRSGRQRHLAQLEYRLPLWDIDWGMSTLPVYVRRLYAAGFADTGDAFDGRFDLWNFAFSVGGELFLQLQLAYKLDLTLRLGLARGLTEGGETQFYVNVGTPF